MHNKTSSERFAKKSNTISEQSSNQKATNSIEKRSSANSSHE
jgi:hypothetical protein